MKKAQRDLQEAYFPRFCAMHKLPSPVAEYQFHPTRRWRFDFAWRDEKVALEVEGGVFGYINPQTMRRHGRGAHGSVAGILNDMEKYNEAALHGWRLLRVLPGKLYSQPTIDMLKRALDA